MTPIGIDISKAFFDAHLNGKNQRYDNNHAGISDFIGKLPQGALCVMEATGSYSARLAEALFNEGIAVSVLNPLIIKRYSQMTMRRTKTDSMDAALITDFARGNSVRPFVPLDDSKNSLKQMVSVLEGLKGQILSMRNSLGSLRELPRVSETAAVILETTIGQLQETIKDLKKKIKAEMKSAYGEVAERLLSIPGFGQETVQLLLVATDGFKTFDSSKQVAAFAGLCPGTRESGSSVRGRGAICRVGHTGLRSKLYMCSLTAMKKNRACRELYERLVLSGKPKKVALVAVAHKLVKQAFAIVKSGVPYDEKIGLAA